MSIRMGLNFFSALAGRNRRRALVVIALVCACLAPQAFGREGGELRGQWVMETKAGGDTVSVALILRPEGGGLDKRFFKLRLDELSDISRAQFFGDGERVAFRLTRRAGVFDFRGSFKAGKGAGDFTFTPDPDFVAEMRRDGYGEAAKQNMIGFATGNYNATFEELAALGMERPTQEQLKSMMQFGVTTEFIRDLKALGYEPRSVDQLIGLRRQGASIEFIKSIESLGYDRPTLDQLLSMRQQAVTVGFIKELESLGYRNVPLDQLISMKQQAVSPDFIRRLNAEGHANVPVNRLLDIRMLGMPAEFLEHLPAAGADDGAQGEWLMKVYGRGPSKAWFYIREGVGKGGGHSIEVSPVQVNGLSEAHAFSGGANVRFTVKTGEGEITCEGWFKDGYGAGTFTRAGRTPKR